MTTNTETAFLVTTCPNHGVKVTGDLASQAVYTDVARACRHENHFDPVGHIIDHLGDPSDCWECCPDMRIADTGEIG